MCIGYMWGDIKTIPRKQEFYGFPRLWNSWIRYWTRALQWKKIMFHKWKKFHVQCQKHWIFCLLLFLCFFFHLCFKALYYEWCELKKNLVILLSLSFSPEKGRRVDHHKLVEDFSSWSVFNCKANRYYSYKIISNLLVCELRV